MKPKQPKPARPTPDQPLTDGPSTELLSGGYGAGIDQIPLEVLTRLGNVFAEGERKYGRDNWRKRTSNDTSYTDERFRHALRHLMLWNEERNGHRAPCGDDHLAKVMWFCGTTMERQRQEFEDAD